MKIKNSIFALLLLGSTNAFTQTNTDEVSVKNAVTQFVEAADTQDTMALNKILDEQFRAAVNRAFGSTILQVIDKKTYIQLASDKKIGGDKREVVFNQIIVEGNIANVFVSLIGSKLIFNSFISLIKNNDGNWIIIQDMPDIIPQ